MKISNNALNFLLAQYRAIFKRAYIRLPLIITLMILVVVLGFLLMGQ